MMKDPFLFDDTRWVEIGVMDEDPKVIDLPGYDNCSRYAGVVLSGDEYAQCRIANIGASSLRGFFFPPKTGDQVLVVFPGGRENSGIILGALNSDATPFPSDADNSKAVLVNEDGVRIQTVAGQPEPVDGDITMVVPATSDNRISALKSDGSNPDFLVKAPFTADVDGVFSTLEGILKGLGFTLGPAYLTILNPNVTTQVYDTDTLEAD